MEQYKIVDTEQVYTNGAELIPIFRMKQWLEHLQDIEPERKTGQWLPDNRPGGGFWVCSECKFPSEAFAANVLYKFCPNCGAYMKGENDG